MKHIKLSMENSIAIVAFRNTCMNREMVEELSEVVGGLFHDKTARVVIFTGEGETFLTGPDENELLQLSPLEAREFTMQVKDLYWTMATLPQVTIAAVNGSAEAIGCEASLCCDMRVVSERASFAHPETAMGLLPGFGGTQRLLRLVGPSYAKEMIFLGEPVSAERAYEIGLANRVVAHDALMQKVMAMAEKIRDNGNYANNLAKHAMNIGAEVDLDSAISLEGDLYALLFSCGDYREGIKARMEKRRPQLTDF